MRKPWNLVDMPVYSLSTKSNDGFHNMNICTYVSSVSMKPKRYAVAVYHDTVTLKNIQETSDFALQLLSQVQYPLVKYFGQKSGSQYDKMAFLDRNQSRLFQGKSIYKSIIWNDFRILENAVFALWLSPIEQLNCGDHTLFLCDVKKSIVFNDNSYLTLSFLRDKKIIRA